MTQATKPSRYPWGSRAPSTQLRHVTSRLLSALAKAEEPGFSSAPQRARDAVRATRLVLEALEHLCAVGHQSRSKQDPYSSDEAKSAIKTTREAVGAFASVSNLTWSESYAKFAEAASALVGVAEEVRQRGISRGGDTTDSIWGEFDG